MKYLKFFLIAVLVVSYGCNKNSFNKDQVEKEVTDLVKELEDHTLNKKLYRLLDLYSKSPDFKMIMSTNQVHESDQLEEIYKSFYTRLVHHKIISSELKVQPLAQNKAYCIWKGKEEIRRYREESFVSEWIATIILEKQDDSWLIKHMHVSH